MHLIRKCLIWWQIPFLHLSRVCWRSAPKPCPFTCSHATETLMNWHIDESLAYDLECAHKTQNHERCADRLPRVGGCPVNSFGLMFLFVSQFLLMAWFMLGSFTAPLLRPDFFDGTWCEKKKDFMRVIDRWWIGNWWRMIGFHECWRNICVHR